jgi:CBS domain-containing protein
MRRLLVPGSGRLAVTHDGKVIGMITRHDILHFIEIHTELEE